MTVFYYDKSDVGHSQRRSVCQAFFYSPFYGVPERIRTSDTRFRRAVLCPLSY